MWQAFLIRLLIRMDSLLRPFQVSSLRNQTPESICIYFRYSASPPTNDEENKLNQPFDIAFIGLQVLERTQKSQPSKYLVTMSHNSFGSLLNQEAASPSSEALHVMIEQECTTYSCCDYFNYDEDYDSCSNASTCSISVATHYSELSSEETVTPADRMKLILWCYAVVDRY